MANPDAAAFWRRMALVGAGVTLVSAAISLLAVVQTRRANQETRIANSRRVVAISELERSKRFDLSLILAVEAVAIERTPEARNNLLAALLTRPELEAFLHTSEGEVSCVAFSPDGKTMAAGYSRGSYVGGGGVVLFDPSSGQRLQAAPLLVTEGTVRDVAFSPDGKVLAAGYSNKGKVGDGGVFDGGGGVVLFEPTSRQRLQAPPLSVTEGSLLTIAFSPDGKKIAVGFGRGGDGEGGVVLFDATSRQRLQDAPLRVNEGYVQTVVFSPEGSILAAGYSNVSNRGEGGGGVVLFDLRNGERLRAAHFPVTEGNVIGAAFSPDGKTMAAGFSVDGDGGGVVLFVATNREWRGRAQRIQTGPVPVREGDVSGVAQSPDGKTLAAGFGNVPLGSPLGNPMPEGGGDRGFGGVVLFDTTTHQRLQAASPPVREGDVSGVTVSPDGRKIAAGYGKLGGGGVVLFDATSRQRLQTGLLPVPEGEVWSVAFSPDGKKIAAGDVDDGDGGGGVVLFDTTSRQRLQAEPLATNEGDVRSVAFSPDGKTLAAADGSGGVVLFDVTTRQRLHPGSLNVTQDDVSGVAFSPDGKKLAAGNDNGVVWIDVDLESWRRQAGRVANRNPTRDEWRRYFPDTPYRPTFKELFVPPE